jgi:hypothetical protein
MRPPVRDGAKELHEVGVRGQAGGLADPVELGLADADRVEHDQGAGRWAEVDVDEVLDDVRGAGVGDQAGDVLEAEVEGAGEDRAEVVGPDLAAGLGAEVQHVASTERAICSSW